MAQKGALPGYKRSWKSIERVPEILRELDMRQGINVPVVDCPTQATVTSRMKAKLPQCALSTQYGTQRSMLSPIVGQDINDVGPSITDLGETDKSWEGVWAVGKIWNREGTQKAEKLLQLAVKCLIKVMRMSLWFDVLAARPPSEKQTGNPMLSVGWPVEDLKT